MKRIFKASVFTAVLLFIMLTPAFFLQPVYAAIDSISTFQGMQDKVTEAMQSRLTSYSLNYTGNTSALQTGITNVINNIYNSDDYLHYVTKSYSYSASGYEGSVIVKFTFAYWESALQTDFVNKQVASILPQIITSGMNDYQKEKAIHDWIITHVAYDTTLAKHSAYSALVAPYKTVCQGYALLTYKMMTEAGIETKILEGTAGGQNHAWNAVCIDGIWYHLDCTWDDPVPDVAGGTSYGYYNLTDNEMKLDHNWTKSYPAASTSFGDTLDSKIGREPSNAAFYQGLKEALDLKYLEAGNTAGNSAELSEKMREAIGKQEPGLKIRYMKVSTLAADLKGAVQNLSNISSYSYTYIGYTRTLESGDIILDLKLTYTIPISVASVSLSKDTLSLAVRAAATLTATVSPPNASNKKVLWTSSDPKVATVAAGVVKAVGGGTAVITVTAVDGSKTASATVSVTKTPTGVKLDKSKLSLKSGSPDVALAATVIPTDATNKEVVWSSSNPAVATVDSIGVVSPMASGTAVITVVTQDGSKKTNCTVTVLPDVSGVTLNKSAVTLKLGQAAVTLVATVAPKNAAVKTVAWTSSNPSVATVSDKGKVTPVAAGTATITATSTDKGYSAACEVAVVQPVTKVTLDEYALTLKVGDADVRLNAAITPDNASMKDVTWTSSNTKVATVSSDGTVHAVAPGTAVITAASKQDKSKAAKCKVKVPVPVTGVKLSKASMTLKMNARIKLSASVLPGSAAIKGVTWTSSNTGVATISETGIVTPVGAGTATITVRTVDGGFTATCEVTVD